MMTILGFILIIILNDLQIISGTLAPTQAPLPFPDDNLIRNSIIVNGTMSPEIIHVCVPTFTPCIDPLIGLIYVPIDYDGFDEPNEFIRVNRPIFGISLECASSVGNKCNTIRTCGLFDVGPAFGNEICVDIEIGSDVDIQCSNFFGFDISDRTFFGQINLYCDVRVSQAPTSSPTPALPVEFLNCGDTKIGSTSPNNFEDRFLFRLDFAGTITFSSCGSSYDTLANIYDVNGTSVAFRDDGSGCPAFNRFNFDFTPIVGQTYIFGISGFGSSTGNYRLTATCTPFNAITRTLPPTSQPTFKPFAFQTTAPSEGSEYFDVTMLVSGTTQNVSVCFDIPRPCIDPTLISYYVPIDYDEIDEPNEYLRITKGQYSYECARNVTNNCFSFERCGSFSFGSLWETPTDACVTFEIGSGVDSQCNNVAGFVDISGLKFFGSAVLLCGSRGFSNAHNIKPNVFTDIKEVFDLKYGIILIVAASIIGCIIVIICCIVFTCIHKKICKKNTTKYTSIKSDSHVSKSEFMSEAVH